MESTSGAAASGGAVQLQLPSGGTSLSCAASVGTLTDILPSPAWSRDSRRQRAPILNTCMSHDSTVSLDHVIRSDSTVSLDHVTEKSSVDIPCTDEVPLDPLSSRSVITGSLDHCFARHVIPVSLDLKPR